MLNPYKWNCVGFSPGSASGVSAGNVSNNSSNRRKSVGHIPLSPLARTPSPSPLPASPTRSPSPLAFPAIVHQPGEFRWLCTHNPIELKCFVLWNECFVLQIGASNTTQSYSPGCALPNNTSLNSSLTSSGSNTPNSTSTNITSNTSSMTTISGGKKSSFVRPKSAEPSSPLLRRALSPDRLHPRSAAETKCLISPLCCMSNAVPSCNSINMHAANAVIGLKKQRNPKNSGSIWRQNITTKQCGVRIWMFKILSIFSPKIQYNSHVKIKTLHLFRNCTVHFRMDPSQSTINQITTVHNQVTRAHRVKWVLSLIRESINHRGNHRYHWHYHCPINRNYCR